MKITVLTGSARNGNTTAMANVFADAAKAAGHEVEVLNVAKMKIAGCLGCEYCHTKGNGACIQKDDLEELMPAYLESDMIVYASPIYYFGMTAQIMAAMQRVYCIGKPVKATKAALLLSSGSHGVYDGAIATYKMMIGYEGVQDMGIVTAAGAENGSEAKNDEIRKIAANL